MRMPTIAPPHVPMGGSEGGGPYQSPNPIDAGNRWAFGQPNPQSFEAKPPRSVQVKGTNPRSTEVAGKGGNNKRY